LAFAGVAQLLDAMFEPACACYLDQAVDGGGVVIDYVDNLRLSTLLEHRAKQ
jgi:hypothetical protein